MDTCILTGRELDSDTRKEHTIPKCLGGTITSRRVSCNDVNHAGSALEETLQSNYLPLLYALAPLLKSSGQPGFTQAECEDGARVRIGADGVVEPAGRFQMGPDGTFTASDRETAKSILRAQGRDLSNIQFMPEPLDGLPKAAYYDRPCEVVSVSTELAALKAITFTLDEMLERASLSRFTRQDALEPLRRYLRTALLDGDTSMHGRFARGYQYNRTEEIKQMARKLTEREPTPFEHTILASGNNATRMLAGVWLVFDTEPIGFCLSTNWRGENFTCAVTCGVLRNTSGGQVVWDDRPRDIVRRTTMGATYYADTQEPPQNGPCIAAVAHFDAIHDAYKRATFLRETTCTEWLSERLAERALDFRGSRVVSIRELLVDRLIRFLAFRDDDPEHPGLRAQIDNHIDQPWAASANLLIQDQEKAHSAALAYMHAFKGVASHRGLPDHLFRKGDAMSLEIPDR